jgi:transposase
MPAIFIGSYGPQGHLPLVDTGMLGVRALSEEVHRGSSKPPYPPEFRREAIRLVQTSGKSRRQIADDLGISAETLRLWVKQAELDAGVRQDGATTTEREELRRLRRENQILREEREILKKAAAFFARETDARR